MSRNKFQFILLDLAVVAGVCAVFLMPFTRQFIRSAVASLRSTFTGLPIETDWVFLAIAFVVVLVFLMPLRQTR